MPFAELIIVLFFILAIVTPFITLALLGKYKKLRQNLDQFAEENSREHASFQREVADLKRQLSAAVHPTPSPAVDAVPGPAVPIAPAVQETPVPALPVDLPAPVKLPAPMEFPASEKKPEPQRVQEPQKPAPVAPTSAPIAPVITPAQELPAAPAPVDREPVLPAAAKTPAEVKPAAPAAPPQTTLPSVTSPQRPAPRIPAPTPRVPTEIPSGAAPRVSVAPPISAYRVPAPKPTFQQRMKTVSAIEEALGTNWLNKLGIIILVVGVALFSIYELGALGRSAKSVSLTSPPLFSSWAAYTSRRSSAIASSAAPASAAAGRCSSSAPLGFTTSRPCAFFRSTLVR